MARARIEYQFGQLVEIEETESEEVENIKKKFKEYGISVPLLADGDLSTAKSFLQCLGLWTGKESTFNQLQKKYVIPLKGNSARRLENVSKNGLRKSFSLNALDKLYIHDDYREPENNRENVREKDRENDRETEGEIASEIIRKSIGPAEKSSEQPAKSEDKIDQEKTEEKIEDQKTEDRKVLNLDDSLEDGEIIEDGEILEDEVEDEKEAVKSAEDVSMNNEPEVTASSSEIKKAEEVKSKTEPEIKPEVKPKMFATKWPKVEKVERRKSLNCLELAKEMISNDFLSTARAILKMKKEEPVTWSVNPKVEYKIEISKKDQGLEQVVQNTGSPKVQAGSSIQSSPRTLARLPLNENQPAQNQFYPTEECINIPSTSTGNPPEKSPVNPMILPTYKESVKPGSKPEDTRICMVTPHVQKRSNSNSRSPKNTGNNSRAPIIVLDNEKAPIHDLVEPQAHKTTSPTVQMSRLAPIQSSQLSFPRKSGLQIGGYQPVIPTVHPHSTVLPHSAVHAQRRPDPRGPSSRVRLTVEALEALLAVPDRFQRIDFGDGKGHLFKKSVHSDKTRYPTGEFFAAKINEQEHYFISLQIENGADCSLDYPCHRRDCPIHITPQFKIGYQCVKGPQVNGFQYRIIRVWHPPNKEVPKSELNRETHLTPMDSQNFNAYILQKLGCSPAECERRIKGKNVPIMVIHALVQLREAFNTMTKTDWKEILIELELMPKWIPKMMSGRNYTEHRVDGKTKLYDRSGYLIELERHVDEMRNFYEKFKHIIKDISIQKQAVQHYQKPTVRNSTIPLYKLEKRQKTSLPSFQ